LAAEKESALQQVEASIAKLKDDFAKDNATIPARKARYHKLYDEYQKLQNECWYLRGQLSVGKAVGKHRPGGDSYKLDQLDANQ
jgi:hypothetical protein